MIFVSLITERVFFAAIYRIRSISLTDAILSGNLERVQFFLGWMESVRSVRTSFGNPDEYKTNPLLLYITVCLSVYFRHFMIVQCAVEQVADVNQDIEFSPLFIIIFKLLVPLPSIVTI